MSNRLFILLPSRFIVGVGVNLSKEDVNGVQDLSNLSLLVRFSDYSIFHP